MSRDNPLEKTIEDSICNKAREQWKLVHRKMNGLGFNSWPDRLFFIPGGKPLFMEMKRRGRNPTEDQARLHDQLRALGYDVVVVDSVEDGMSILKTRMMGFG
jgi:hypothetical protein